MTPNNYDDPRRWVPTRTPDPLDDFMEDDYSDADQGVAQLRYPGATPDPQYSPASPGGDDEMCTVEIKEPDAREAASVHRKAEIAPGLQELFELVTDETRDYIRETDKAIFSLVEALGGNSHTYARERRAQLRNIASEVRSPPIAARVAKRLPRRGITEKGRQVKAVISEIYSPPRVTHAAKMLPGLGLLPGFALDLTTTNAQGEAWDFDDVSKQQEAWDLIEKQKPLILVGSPMCTAFCAWQKLNQQRRDLEIVEQELRKATMHMEFVCRLYKAQVEAGRYFLHEHPATASSWELRCIKEVLHLDGVDVTHGDQCQYGQRSIEGSPIKKGIRWMSNAPAVLKSLGRRCRGRGGSCTMGGRHATCSGNRAKAAAVYPFRLCKAILEGFSTQLKIDQKLARGIYGIHCDVEVDLVLQDQCSEWMDAKTTSELNAMQQVERYLDAVTGQPLIPALVRAARAEELRYFETKGVWHRRPRAEALMRTGKAQQG